MPKNRSSTTGSSKDRDAYLSGLEVPSSEKMEEIAQKQEQNEREIRAASIIQRHYRGHRYRRAIEGMGLDPSMRWIEAVKEAQYRNLTQPRSRNSVKKNPAESVNHVTDEKDSRSSIDFGARDNWKRVGKIARRAGGDSGDDVEYSGEDQPGLTEEQRAEKRRKNEEKKANLKKNAKLMDLQYFLEMVDLKHRYGSNLRAYHQEWQKADTTENFFYWLDYGEGREISLSSVPRDRLDREQVRYLSREERMDYLVKVDNEGRLCWAKNGVRIDTSEKYKDSLHGIVPVGDATPAYSPEVLHSDESSDTSSISSGSFSSSSSSSSSASGSEDFNIKADGHKANKAPRPTKGSKKVKHISAATLLAKLLRKSVKKNTWIFVADTSFRLYVGIKQSGAFQHSSFLHGARIAAAGLIKIKDGQLRSLSPLSGHYRPPTSNFRAFVHALKTSGIDMSRVSISKAYAVLVGLEAYTHTRRKVKKARKAVHERKEKALHPEKAVAREERDKERSKSDETEAQFMEWKEKEKQAERVQQEEMERDENATILKIMRKLHVTPRTPKHRATPQSRTSSVATTGEAQQGVPTAETK